MICNISNSLNNQQKKAIECFEGPSIIMAGAGSGKTRVLVQKVLYLIHDKNLEADSIVMITFTNKAALEMKNRVEEKIGFIGTFHSFCANILRKYGPLVGVDNNYVIYDDNDQIQLIKNILKKYDITHFTPAYFSNKISAAKNQLIDSKRYLELFSDHNAPLVHQVYVDYTKGLRSNHAVDFDDLIMLSVELLIKHNDVLIKYQNQYRFFLVDEFQDTNYAQYTLTRILGNKYYHVTAVGDFSQSIYSWRGADIRNLEKFKEDFPNTTIFHLEENYRSSQNILDFAYDIISKNQTHPILELYTKNPKGEEVEFVSLENEQYEAIYLTEKIKELSINEALNSFAILYRTNAQSRVIEESFLHSDLPYVLIGGTRFYERKEVKDVLSYLRLLINPIDEIATDRIKKIGIRKWNVFKEMYNEIKESVINTDSIELMEQVFQKTGYLTQYDSDNEEDYARLENIKELRSVAISFPNILDFLQQVALVETEYSEGEKHNKNTHGVRLMTLHQAKGLEFKYVFIVGVEDGILPHSRSIDDIYSLEEERRLFYVGITRAKKKLFVTYAKKRFIFGRRGETIKSRFLGEDEEWDSV
ncbi:MAG: UvrD-helicase domain-containing protein [bacterium]|nr:UvrD-helicase domain-containing protein [bacterium]